MGSMYESFAKVYDTFMDNVPYDEWARCIIRKLREDGIEDGLVLDLGCGTGQMTRRLADAGYDMIGADGSADIRYAGNTATANITKKLDTDGVTVVNGILEWKAGKKYTYKIDAGLEYIRFSAQTEAAWTSQSGDIEIPKN